MFKKLPQEDPIENPRDDAKNALVALLKERRFNDSTDRRPSRKKTRLDLAPGCSVSTCSNLEPDTPQSAHSSNDTIGELSIPRTFKQTIVREQYEQLTEGQYILAKFKSHKGKITFKYVCKIMEILPEIAVLGLKSVSKNKKRFRVVPDDISVISRDDIVELLENAFIEQDADAMFSIYFFQSSYTCICLISKQFS